MSSHWRGVAVADPPPQAIGQIEGEHEHRPDRCHREEKINRRPQQIAEKSAKRRGMEDLVGPFSCRRKP
jgi:hypothetical protein